MNIYKVDGTMDPAFMAIIMKFDPDKHSRDELILGLREKGHTHRYITPVAYKDAVERAKKQADSIWESYRYLRDTFAPISAKARGFWREQTNRERKAYLKKAWGGELPQVHRPDLVAFLDQVAGINREVTNMVPGAKKRLEKETDRFLLPHINYADLVGEDDSLPSLMESRAHNDPCAFWEDDLRRQALGQNILTHVFVPYAEMDFRSESGYGVPRSFKPVEVGPETKRILLFETKTSGEGFLILDAQKRLYEFLRNMGKSLLKGMEAVLAAEGENMQVIAPPAISTGLGYLRMILDEPYILLTSDDIQHLSQLSRAHVNASEDHLWKLRENPHYYRETVREQVDHHWGWVRDKHGKMFPGIDNFSLGSLSTTNTTIWEWAVRRTLVLTVLFCEMWNQIFQEIGQIELAIQHPPRVDAHIALENAYISAVFLLRQCLQTLVGLCDGGEMFFSHPNVRRFLVRTTPAEATIREQNKSTFTKTQNLNRDDDRDRLIRTFQLLSLQLGIEYAGLRNLASYTMFLSEGRATTETASQVTNLFSPLARRFLGDLSSMTEILYQLERSQPPRAHYLQFKLSKELDAKFSANFGTVITRLTKTAKTPGMLTPLMLNLGAPVGACFEYPIDMPPNKKRREQILKGEKRLTSFWEQILTTEIFTEATGYLNQVIKSQTIFRTPKDVPSIPAAVASTSTTVASSSQTAPPEPVAPFGGTPQPQTSAQSLPAVPKEKEKTRGVPGESSTDPPPAEPEVEMTEAPLRFELDADGWRVVNMLFHIPGARPGNEVRWTEFLRLLRVMGFDARQLGGSAWVFTPTPASALQGKGPVIVHEPHGSGGGGRKLTFQYARVNGDILRHRYGISGENFALGA